MVNAETDRKFVLLFFISSLLSTSKVLFGGLIFHLNLLKISVIHIRDLF